MAAPTGRVGETGLLAPQYPSQTSAAGDSQQSAPRGDAASKAGTGKDQRVSEELGMFDWKSLLKQFDRWENTTAAFSTEVLRSPLLLNPIGSAITQTFQAKSGLDRVLQQCWSALGLPTRTEQERVLHALNQLESRLYDLEEKLSDLREPPRAEGRGRAGKGTHAPVADAEFVESAAEPTVEAAPVLQRSKDRAPRKPRPRAAAVAAKGPAAKAAAPRVATAKGDAKAVASADAAKTDAARAGAARTARKAAPKAAKAVAAKVVVQSPAPLFDPPPPLAAAPAREAPAREVPTQALATVSGETAEPTAEPTARTAKPRVRKPRPKQTKER